MQIRLFTSGTHNGLSFSNPDIINIAAKTEAGSAAKIPIVLGHPTNDLPVFGYLSKSAIKQYREGDKISLGFDREAAEIDESGMEAIRQLGRNKLSVRIEDGMIKHIGLVKKAAVAENNAQDFAALTGDFAAPDDFEAAETAESLQIWENLKRIFKSNKTQDFMNKDEEVKKDADFTALQSEVKNIATTVNNLATILTGQQAESRKTALATDFEVADFTHLTDEQKAKAIDFCVKMSDSEVITYKEILKAGNKKPETPPHGSMTMNFGKDDKGERSTLDVVREQMSAVK